MCVQMGGWVLLSAHEIGLGLGWVRTGSWRVCVSVRLFAVSLCIAAGARFVFGSRCNPGGLSRKEKYYCGYSRSAVSLSFHSILCERYFWCQCMWWSFGRSSSPKRCWYYAPSHSIGECAMHLPQATKKMLGSIDFSKCL